MNPKRKGSAFERKICKSLSEWYSSGINANIFWRTSSSGARATQKSLTVHRGDITNIENEGIEFIRFFVIECKSYKEIDFLKAIDVPFGGWYKWWQQCEKDALASDRHPFLIMHRNNHGTYVVLHTDILKKIFTIPTTIPIISFCDLTLMSFTNFLKYIPPRNIKDFIKSTSC